MIINMFKVSPKSLVVCFLLTFNSSISLALDENSCGAIYRDSLVYVKNYHGENADATTVGLFNGYVMASLDWYIYFNKEIDEKPNIGRMVNVGQIALIFSEYLEKHPEQHDKSGLTCFINAMKEAFP